MHGADISRAVVGEEWPRGANPGSSDPVWSISEANLADRLALAWRYEPCARLLVLSLTLR